MVYNFKQVMPLKVKFLWPNAYEGLFKFLQKFASDVLTTTKVLANFGMTRSFAIFNNLKRLKFKT